MKALLTNEHPRLMVGMEALPLDINERIWLDVIISCSVHSGQCC